jgi:hypothetical protein
VGSGTHASSECREPVARGAAIVTMASTGLALSRPFSMALRRMLAMRRALTWHWCSAVPLISTVMAPSASWLAKSVAAISPRTSRAGAGAPRQGDEQVEAGDGQRRVAPAAVGNHLRQAVFEGRRGEQAGLRVDHASGVQ